MPAGCILWAQQSVSAGYGLPLACAAVLQSMPVSCHFRGCKAPLSRIVSGAISSELPLPLTNGFDTRRISDDLTNVQLQGGLN